MWREVEKWEERELRARWEMVGDFDVMNMQTFIRFLSART